MADVDKEKYLTQVMSHYEKWTDDINKRLTRKQGWNEITDAYYGKLPKDWPFKSKTVDPRIKTTLLEKNSRLTNGKLRGRFVPKEGGDVLGAKINNAVIDTQWESTHNGMSMNQKISVGDLDARLYGSKFYLNLWKTIAVGDKVEYDGNDSELLDIRDCGMDWMADHIRSAKWFQHRSWEFVEDLEAQVDESGSCVFENLDKIRADISDPKYNAQSSSANRDKEYQRRVLQIKGLEDRASQDIAFPIVQVVTEYRKDKWITFAPDHNVILRCIDNPYDHGQIPVSQLRYYPTQDDPLGESEVESVLPLWLAIQAVLDAYLDEVMLKIRPPIIVNPRFVNVESVIFEPEALWISSDITNAYREVVSGQGAIAQFQNTYPALISAFSNAMGGLSQGTSSASPFEQDKTATEVKATERQQNVRDQKNQADLAEFIKDVVYQWRVNNKQFLFADPKKSKYVLKIVGRNTFEDFKAMGLAEMDLDPEVEKMIADIVEQNPDITNAEINTLIEAGKTPRFPVYDNPKEKDPEKITYKSKMRISDQGSIADLTIIPSDLDGNYDYIPDVTSMSSSASADASNGKKQAFDLITNETVLKLLAQEGLGPNIKEIINSSLEEFGQKDGEKYIQPIKQPFPGTQPVQGASQPVQNGGVQGVPTSPVGGAIPEQVAFA